MTHYYTAASTRLHMDENGEPLKTNLGSTIALRKLIDRKPLKVHVISTAYVCGLIQGKVVKEVNHPRGDFVNVHEESKWKAEQIWMGKATILKAINFKSAALRPDAAHHSQLLHSF